MSGMPSTLATRFSYPLVAGLQADPLVIAPTDYGEIPTATKITDLARYQRDTILDTLGAIYCGASGNRRSGVLDGLQPEPTTNAMQVRVGPGTGLYYNLAETRTKAVVCRETTVTLDAPDGTNDRYDLIVARPNGANYGDATRLIKYGTGVVDSLSLPYEYREGITLVVFKGTPAGSPAVPACELYDIPIALVLVQSGAPAVIAAGDCLDVRPWLAPRVGGTSKILIRATIDAGGAVTALTETSTDPTIQPSATVGAFQKTADGTWMASYKFPATFGSHATQWFSSAMCVVTRGGATGGFTINGEVGVTGPVAGFYTVTLTVFAHAADTAFALANPGAGNIQTEITFLRAD